ncbi:MAG: hypothetical protein KDE15_12285 [Erythrobacter sp.]|nr:hypothetical protein [Erythrobacter sp.]
MSKSLAFSAALSVFAMAAFALFAGPHAQAGLAVTQTGATVEAAAPAVGQVAPALFGQPR